jgi:hypothetical protein
MDEKIISKGYYKDTDDFVLIWGYNRNKKGHYYKFNSTKLDDNIMLIKTPHGKIIGISIQHFKEFVKENTKKTPTSFIVTPTYSGVAFKPFWKYFNSP